jgi:hypothetical protein
MYVQARVSRCQGARAAPSARALAPSSAPRPMVAAAARPPPARARAAERARSGAALATSSRSGAAFGKRVWSCAKNKNR